MALAAERDAIAREYVTDFKLTFETGVPALHAARRDGLPWTDAVVEAYLALLDVSPDTHIARKLGPAEAEAVSFRVREVRAAGGSRSPAGRRALAALDVELRDPRNRRNPGTTADLTCAALFVVIIEGGWDR
jgi:triphosphoribosyl-dephospho-CoA synthase